MARGKEGFLCSWGGKASEFKEKDLENKYPEAHFKNHGHVRMVQSNTRMYLLT